MCTLQLKYTYICTYEECGVKLSSAIRNYKCGFQQKIKRLYITSDIMKKMSKSHRKVTIENFLLVFTNLINYFTNL